MLMYHILHRIGVALSRFAMWYDTGPEPRRWCYHIWCIGGNLEGYADDIAWRTRQWRASKE